MPDDLIIVPSYRRADFLYLCLEAIYAAEDSADKTIRVFEDNKLDSYEKLKDDLEEVQEVLTYWKRGFGGRLHTYLRPLNSYYGNSYNILDAYKKAYSEDWRYVYLIEDDVLISQDFFKWHEAILEDGEDHFCTLAGKTDRNPIPDTKSDYFQSEIYASLGVAWPRENLAWTNTHAVKPYYENPTLHILKYFKHSKYGLTLIEQDGLIQRIAEQSFIKFTWATKPRAFHVGVWGYHRGIAKEDMFVGTLPERIENLRSSVHDPEWFKKVADFQTDLQALPT